MNPATARLRDALLRGRMRPPVLAGGAPIARRGDGYEFVELRSYVAGDDPRRIDWAATARAGELQTRVLLEDVGLTLAAVVDTSASMLVGRHAAPLAGARRALSEWYGTAQNGDRCIVVDDAGVFAPPGLRGANAARTAAVRAGAGGGGRFDLVRALRNAGAALAPGTALLVISDFWDLPADARATLLPLALRLDCTALHAADPWNGAIPLAGFVRLRDAEGRGSRTLYFGRRERERYRAQVAQRESALAQLFHSSGWRYAAYTESGPERALYAAFGLAG